MSDLTKLKEILDNQAERGIKAGWGQLDYATSENISTGEITLKTTDTKSKPRAVMLTDEEYGRILTQVKRYGKQNSYSEWMRTLALEVCEREEKKEK